MQNYSNFVMIESVINKVLIELPSCLIVSNEQMLIDPIGNHKIEKGNDVQDGCTC